MRDHHDSISERVEQHNQVKYGISNPTVLQKGYFSKFGTVHPTSAQKAQYAATHSSSGGGGKGNPIKSIAKAVSNVGKQINTNVQHAGSGIAKTVGTAGQQVKTNVQHAGSGIAKTVGTAGQQVKTNVKRVGGALDTAGQQVKTNVKRVGGALDTAGQQVKTNANRLGGALDTAGQQVKTNANRLGAAIHTAAHNPELENIGSRFITGGLLGKNQISHGGHVVHNAIRHLEGKETPEERNARLKEEAAEKAAEANQNKIDTENAAASALAEKKAGSGDTKEEAAKSIANINAQNRANLASAIAEQNAKYKAAQKNKGKQGLVAGLSKSTGKGESKGGWEIY